MSAAMRDNRWQEQAAHLLPGGGRLGIDPQSHNVV